MLPHVAPRRTKCTVFGYAVAGAIERLPDHDPRQQRGEGHSRSCSTSITVSQPTRMLLHVMPGQPIWLDSPSPHKLPPKSPGLSAPKRKRCSQNPDAILASSGCTGLSLRRSRVAAACRLRQSGRRDRGPVALPRSGCPVRRSRHPAAFVQASPRPSSRRSPRHFAVATSGSAAVHARKTPCHIHRSI